MPGPHVRACVCFSFFVYRAAFTTIYGAELGPAGRAECLQDVAWALGCAAIPWRVRGPMVAAAGRIAGPRHLLHRGF